MKILITTDTYSPIINGVVTSIKNLYKELKANGHEVKILTLSHTGVEMVDGDVYYLKSIRIGVYPDARVKVPLYNKLIKEVIKWGPDVIHSQTEFSMMIVSKHISNKLKIPHMHTYHTLYENYLDYLLGGIINKNLSAKITKRILNNLNIVIAATNKTKDTLLSYGIDRPIYVIPTGIELNKFQRNLSAEDKQKIMSDLKISQDDRIIGYVGRIAEEKNISEILMLLPDVIKKNKKVKLLIVGGGPYLDHLKDLVKTQNLEENVIFTGMISADEVYKYYKISEIFVNASTSETQGLTFIEALSSGCPVVCKYDACIDGVIVQGSNGYSYKEQDKFTSYINEILEDSSLRQKMSVQAVIKANEYSSSIFANKVLDKYSSMTYANKEANIPLVDYMNPKIQKR
ncbi:glycosyltransferase family 4 protein [Paenibacillus sp. 19GGS1-52]|uniref:glycosyltransferase family 4 protein n=1 Tax=Paenibacillus sp. 19GGS1-52 TaxID=2758563 RepID=UPI001EFC051C|nr:glycosyltransferase family 4 protein [Paenibacillus sp. 19GGS1-52]ULO06203.1 glycosyltransferase family 4 protein [Paenibacillus sp. 19GGS1-52]